MLRVVHTIYVKFHFIPWKNRFNSVDLFIFARFWRIRPFENGWEVIDCQPVDHGKNLFSIILMN